MFSWLREKVRNAILAGINDAVEVLEKHGASDCEDATRLFEERIRLLPAPDGEDAATARTGTRKGRSA